MKANNGSVPNNELKKSFVFVLNLIDVSGQLPIEVAPGHFFQKADTKQIKKIDELLNLFRPYPHRIFVQSPYEVNIIKVPGDKPGSYSYKHEPLPPNKWRYWIISFEGSNAEIEYVASAASLLGHDLELGFTVLAKEATGAEGFAWHMPSMFSFFDSPQSNQPAVLITVDELREISENYDLIKKINRDHEHITRAFRKLRDLKSLPRPSELATIGLFSIIESLVTHSPKLSESADSLKHQIKTKIPLLSKRFQRRLDCSEYFGAAEKETIWSKLYDYRSCIVHGERTNFTGSLQVLKDTKTVRQFLREAVKLLLLLALKEPLLLIDLKKC